MPHHDDRFGTALSVLAGHGHIKNRLIQAFEDNLGDIDEASLPRSVSQAFSRLRDRMTAVAPLNGEGPICASVRKMSIVEADECARMLVDIYGDLLRSKSVAKPVPVDSDDDVAEVPTMLLKTV